MQEIRMRTLSEKDFIRVDIELKKILRYCGNNNNRVTEKSRLYQSKMAAERCLQALHPPIPVVVSESMEQLKGYHNGA